MNDNSIMSFGQYKGKPLKEFQIVTLYIFIIKVNYMENLRNI